MPTAPPASSDSTDRRTGGSRLVVRAGNALLAVLGVAAVGWACSGQPESAEQLGTALTGGLVLLSVPAASAVRSASPRVPAPVSHAWGPQGPVVELGLRPHPLVAVVVIAAAFCVLLGWVVVAGGLDGGGWLALPFLLLFASLVPDNLRALLRRPALRVDADRIELHGWSVDAGVGWDDVDLVDLASPHRRRPVVRVAARPGSTSYAVRQRRLVHQLDLVPDTPAVDVPVVALDHPGALVVWLQELASRDRAGRVALLSPDAVALLDGTLAREDRSGR